MKRILCCVLFCLFLLHAGQARANLVSGGVATGSIVAGGTSDQYFTGTSGQSVVLSAAAGYNANIIVYLPSGTLWGSSLNRFNGSGPLPATGTYHVVIKGQFTTDSGASSLYYVFGGGSISGGTLTSGGTVNAIQSVNGMTSYQFPGATGQGIQINVGNSFGSTNSTIIIFNPDQLVGVLFKPFHQYLDSKRNLNKITDALSQVTNITAIDTSGRPTKVVDPNSVETDLMCGCTRRFI